MYRATTRNIRVSVTPEFMPQQAFPPDRPYFWAYTVEIVNEGTETVRLRSRHWLITDGEGRLEEVRGDGVVGKQPVLRPASGSNIPAAARCQRRRASCAAAT